MEVLAAFLILFAFLTTAQPLIDVPEDEVAVFDDAFPSAPAMKFEVKPFSQFKDDNIIKQQFDYSCGSAALATLLNFYLGEALTEQQVIQGLMDYGDKRAIEQRRAFSLLDMKQFVSVLGYQGAGYTAELEDLKSLDKPCIVPIEFFGYKHFVVYKGIYADHVYFADPYMGNISFTVTEFLKMWHKNIIFLVTGDGAAIDALCLKEDDLRVVQFAMTRDILPENPRRSSHIMGQQKIRESIGKGGNDSLGKYQYKNTKAY